MTDHTNVPARVLFRTNTARLLMITAAATLVACGRDDPPPAPPAPAGSATAPATAAPGGPDGTTAGGPATGAPASTQAATPAAGPDQTATPDGAATDPQRFLIMAASAGQLELAASRLAQQKATHTEVKAFAERMIADHGKANEELKALAATKNVALTEELQPPHKTDLDTLSGLEGAAFDQAYAQRIGVQSHMSAVTLFQKAAAEMQDPEIKAFAERTLPALREHLDQAQKLNQTVAARS